MKARLKSGVLRVVICFCKSPVTVGTKGGYYYMPSPLGKALRVDFRLFGFGGMLRYTVGRGLAPAANKNNKFHFCFGFDDLN